MKPYECLEHTADMGLVVRGKRLSELLAHAAQGLFETIAVVGTVDKTYRSKFILRLSLWRHYLWDGLMNSFFGTRRKRSSLNAQKSSSAAKWRCW